MSGVYMIKTAIVVAVISATYIFTCVFLENNVNKESEDKHNTVPFSGEKSSGFTPKQPNIVFIVIDDLGYNDVSYNGKLHESAILTPNIDRLAAEGITLNNYYVQTTCTPSRASFMTGRYPIHLGLQHDQVINSEPACLPLDEILLPEKLKEAGYATHAVGKWHLGFYKKECLPTARGFDTFFGLYGAMLDHFTHSISQSVDNITLAGYDLHQDTTDSFRVAWEEFGHYSTEMYSRVAQNVISQHAPRKQPLFLYLPILAPHSPLEVPNQYKNPYQDVIQDSDRLTLAGMVTHIDDAVGSVINALKESGLYDNTIIIFSTDNGGDIFNGGNNWPLRGTKGVLWEGGIHAVGFIHSPLLPNKVKGTSSQTLIHASDWYPTIVSSLAGGDLRGTNQLDGYDVWDSIITNSPSPRTEILHNIDPVEAPTQIWLGCSALRMGDWKLITRSENLAITNTCYPPPESGLTPILPPVVSPEKGYWLFNIAEDPTEDYDLSDERPGIVKRMLQRLNEYNQTMVPPIIVDIDLNCDPALHGGVWGPWE